MTGGATTQAPQTPTTGPAQQPQMPQWQQGLLGAMTGSPAYGQNAPALNMLLQRTMPGATGQQPQQMPMQRPMPMGGQSVPIPGMGPGTAGISPGTQPMTRPPVPGQSPQQQMDPQTMMLLAQRFPQLFGQQR